MGLLVFVQSKKILFYIASILEYLFFFLPDRICISFSVKHAMLIGFWSYGAFQGNPSESEWVRSHGFEVV